MLANLDEAEFVRLIFFLHWAIIFRGIYNLGSLFPQKYFSPNQQRSFGRTGYICRLWCRDFFFRVEKIFFSSREFFLWSRELFLRFELWQLVEDFILELRFFFFWVGNFFIESRIPDIPCRHLPPKRSNDMAVCRSVGYVAFLYIVVLLQVADGNVEDLERFLLSIQDCISHI